jgi:hypothetical protein
MPIEGTDPRPSCGAAWAQPLPRKTADAQYDASRIAGTAGIPREKTASSRHAPSTPTRCEDNDHRLMSSADWAHRR